MIPRKPAFLSVLHASQWERLYLKLGPGAEEWIKENPYRLCAHRIPLRVIDEVAGKLGIQKSDLRRCVALAKEELDKLQRSGDCYILLHTLSHNAGFGDHKLCAEAITEADIAVVEQQRYVYPRKLHAAEVHLADWLRGRV